MLQNKHHKKKNSSTQFLFLGSKIFQDLASQPSAKDLPRPALRPRTSQSSSPRARARAHPSGEKQGLPLPVAGHHPTLDQTMNWSKKENGRHFWEVNLRIINSSEKGIMYIILYNMNNDSIYLVDSQIRSKSQARQMHPPGLSMQRSERKLHTISNQFPCVMNSRHFAIHVSRHGSLSHACSKSYSKDLWKNMLHSLVINQPVGIENCKWILLQTNGRVEHRSAGWIFIVYNNMCSPSWKDQPSWIVWIVSPSFPHHF